MRTLCVRGGVRQHITRSTARAKGAGARGSEQKRVKKRGGGSAACVVGVCWGSCGGAREITCSKKQSAALMMTTKSANSTTHSHTAATRRTLLPLAQARIMAQQCNWRGVQFLEDARVARCAPRVALGKKKPHARRDRHTTAWRGGRHICAPKTPARRHRHDKKGGGGPKHIIIRTAATLDESGGRVFCPRIGGEVTGWEGEGGGVHTKSSRVRHKKWEWGGGGRRRKYLGRGRGEGGSAHGGEEDEGSLGRRQNSPLL